MGGKKGKAEGGKKGEAVQKKTNSSMKEGLARMKVWQLVMLLVVVVVGTVFLVGAVSGWFGGSKVVLDSESLCEGGCEMVNLTGEEYEGMVDSGKSFILFVDQSGCTTADKLRGFAMNWAREKGVKIYKIMFSDARETSLHENVKYYPSVVVVSRGKPVAWLRADEDEDSDAYNKEEAFVEWISGWL